MQKIQTETSRWLRSYYFIRSAVALIWFACALSAGTANPLVAAVLLLVYPAWDAIANYLDAARSGGLRSNPSQRINIAISSLATVAVGVALPHGLNAVIAVLGAWAVAAGVLQLVTGVRRWTLGGQWVMVLSGAQSALAGVFFVVMGLGEAPLTIAKFAPYTLLGAVYFLIAGVWLSVKSARGRRAAAV